MIVIDNDQQTVIVTTKGNAILCSEHFKDISSLSPCTHEEADTRMVLHAYDSVKVGLTKVMMRTVDTDVVVISISFAKKINI